MRSQERKETTINKEVNNIVLSKCRRISSPLFSRLPRWMERSQEEEILHVFCLSVCLRSLIDDRLDLDNP